jgi:hypothetical protein
VHVVPQGLAQPAPQEQAEDTPIALVGGGAWRQLASEPPPLYAFDPDIGRLAVTTPAYNTAIVAVNQRAFPYGGLDLARLFDSRQDVVANIGGRPPAAFGMVVRDIAGKRARVADGRPSLARRPCAFTRPVGVLLPGRAAPCRDVHQPARGRLARRGRCCTSPIASRATRSSPRGGHPRRRARYTADVLFPSWGGSAPP